MTTPAIVAAANQSFNIEDNQGSLFIKLSPRDYVLPKQYQDESQLLAAIATLRSQQKEIPPVNVAAYVIASLLDLNLNPSNLISFQKQFPKVWEQIQDLLFEVSAKLETNYHALGENGKTRFFAAQAKDFLKNWVVIENNGAHYTYRHLPLERSGRLNGKNYICRNNLPGTTNFNYAQGNFIPAFVYQELEQELLRDVTHPEGEACYYYSQPKKENIEIVAKDQKIPEQAYVALQSQYLGEGEVRNTTWELLKSKSGFNIPIFYQKGVASLNTPKVVADDQESYTFKVSFEDEYGRIFSREVDYAVQNNINEDPNIKVDGPKRLKAGQEIVLTAQVADPNPADRKSLKVTWEVPSMTCLAKQVSKDGIHLTLQLEGSFFKMQSVKIKATVTDQHGAKQVAWHTVVLKPQEHPEISTILKSQIHDLPANDPVRKKMETLAKLGKIYVLPIAPGTFLGADNLVGRLQKIIAEPKLLKHQVVGLVTDESGSMGTHLEDVQSGFAKITSSLNAASTTYDLAFMGYVDDNFNLRAGLAVATRKGNNAVELDQLKKAFVPSLEAMKSGGGIEYTATAIDKMLTEIGKVYGKNIPEGEKRKIIVLTDEKGDLGKDGLTIDKVAAKAAQLGVEVEVVMLVNFQLHSNMMVESLIDYGRSFGLRKQRHPIKDAYLKLLDSLYIK